MKEGAPPPHAKSNPDPSPPHPPAPSFELRLPCFAGFISENNLRQLRRNGGNRRLTLTLPDLELPTFPVSCWRGGVCLGSFRIGWDLGRTEVGGASERCFPLPLLIRAIWRCAGDEKGRRVGFPGSPAPSPAPRRTPGPPPPASPEKRCAAALPPARGAALALIASCAASRAQPAAWN